MTYQREEKFIHSKWAYKIKLVAIESVVHFKAQLVAKGFTQKEGLDYKNPLNPIVKFDYIKTIVSIVVVENMDVIGNLMHAPHFYIVKMMKIF
jgi:hypothetical protein